LFDVTPGTPGITAGKNSATNDGWWQYSIQETNLTLTKADRCTYFPPPTETDTTDYSCLLAHGDLRCAGERGSPVQCQGQVAGENIFCGLVVDQGHCYKTHPIQPDPPVLVQQVVIHTSVLKEWISETIKSRF